MVERNYAELLRYAQVERHDSQFGDSPDNYDFIIRTLEAGKPVIIEVKLEDYSDPDSRPIIHRNTTGNLDRALGRVRNRFNRRYRGMDASEIHTGTEVRLRVGDISARII
jgi:hypothetical protein